MPDAFDQNAQDVGLSLDLIEEEILAGLPAHADRLCAAFDAEEYYAGRNVAYVPRRESEDWNDYLRRPKRTSKLTRKVVRKLTEDLYTPGPMRKLGGNAAADAWLQDVYAKNHINPLMQSADRKATLNGVAAIQAVATGRPEKPVRLYLWGAHEFVVWAWPDDPGEAWAVCTIAREQRAGRNGMEQRARYEAWTRDEHRVYRTRWQPVPSPQNYTQRRYRDLFGQPARLVPDLSGEPAGSGQNPYGTLPFSFVHDEPPISDFYEGGIGGILRECNAEVDRELSDLAQHAREFMDPDRFTRGVSSSWRREKRPGQWQALTANKATLEDGGVQPEALIVQPELNVETIWYNARTYVNQTLQELDVPLVATIEDASVEASGIAIVAKHVPLLQRTKARQPQFTVAEADLAAMVLAVAGNFYSEPQLTAAALDPTLAVIWPEPKFPLPTPERDAEDLADLEAGRKSVVQVTAERFGLNKDQAWDQLLQVLDENERYADELKKRGLTSPDPLAPPTTTTTDPNSPDGGNGAAAGADPDEDADTDE